MSRWRTMIRSIAHRCWFNPLFTTWYDWLWPPQSLGQRGERIAQRLLQKKGLVVIERGYREKFGEIDLIAIDDRTVVFVEVKTRSTDVAGAPWEAVDEQKQRKITRVATMYLKKHGLLDSRCRFDVVAIETGRPRNRPKIQHITDAFEAADI